MYFLLSAQPLRFLGSQKPKFKFFLSLLAKNRLHSNYLYLEWSYYAAPCPNDDSFLLDHFNCLWLKEIICIQILLVCYFPNVVCVHLWCDYTWIADYMSICWLWKFQVQVIHRKWQNVKVYYTLRNSLNEGKNGKYSYFILLIKYIFKANPSLHLPFSYHPPSRCQTFHNEIQSAFMKLISSWLILYTFCTFEWITRTSEEESVI